MHPADRSAANHVVAIHGGIEGDARKKIGFELRPKLLQFIEREAIEFATPLQTIAHR